MFIQNVQGKLGLPRRYVSKNLPVVQPYVWTNNVESVTEITVDYQSSCEGLEIDSARRHSIWQHTSLDSTFLGQNSKPISNTTEITNYISGADLTLHAQTVFTPKEQFWTDTSACLQNGKSVITTKMENQLRKGNHSLVSPIKISTESAYDYQLDADCATDTLQNNRSNREDTKSLLNNQNTILNSRTVTNYQDHLRWNSLKRTGSLLNKQYNRIKTTIDWFENNMLN